MCPNMLTAGAYGACAACACGAGGQAAAPTRRQPGDLFKQPCVKPLHAFARRDWMEFVTLVAQSSTERFPQKYVLAGNPVMSVHFPQVRF